MDSCRSPCLERSFDLSASTPGWPQCIPATSPKAASTTSLGLARSTRRRLVSRAQSSRTDIPTAVTVDPMGVCSDAPLNSYRRQRSAFANRHNFYVANPARWNRRTVQREDAKTRQHATAGREGGREGRTSAEKSGGEDSAVFTETTIAETRARIERTREANGSRAPAPPYFRANEDYGDTAGHSIRTCRWVRWRTPGPAPPRTGWRSWCLSSDSATSGPLPPASRLCPGGAKVRQGKVQGHRGRRERGRGRLQFLDRGDGE